jgi:hypothetical protein
VTKVTVLAGAAGDNIKVTTPFLICVDIIIEKWEKG